MIKRELELFLSINIFLMNKKTVAYNDNATPCWTNGMEWS